MAAPQTFTLKAQNTKRAAWDFGDDIANPQIIQIDGDSGGGPGLALIEVPLELPIMAAGEVLKLLYILDIEVFNFGDNGNGVDWSIDFATFTQDTQTGHITFGIYNHTIVGQGDQGNFYVAVERRDRL